MQIKGKFIERSENFFVNPKMKEAWELKTFVNLMRPC